MKYWDSSALVPLIVQQTQSPNMLELYREDPDVLTWWGTLVECTSALMRLEREDGLDAVGIAAAQDRLEALAARWTEILPREPLRRTALRMLRVHALRAADALQLAAAMVVCGHEPERLRFVSLDGRLNSAAGREGFRVTHPAR
jgi:uncharacterized protein